MRQIILDTETTGLSPAEGHRIIEIGCVELVNRRITGRTYHQYLNPEREIDAEAQAVHGITLTFLQDKPTFAKIANDFMAFIEGAELVIHNAPFDVGFIDHELKLLNSNKKISTHFQIVDTLVLARQIHPGQRNSLDALCKRYGVDLTRRDLHGALLDSNLLAQVYLAMTGGQVSFFGDSLSSESEKNNQTDAIQAGQQQVVEVLDANPLPIIYADEQENKLHEQYLIKMRENGKCVWN